MYMNKTKLLSGYNLFHENSYVVFTKFGEDIRNSVVKILAK